MKSRQQIIAAEWKGPRFPAGVLLDFFPEHEENRVWDTVLQATLPQDLHGAAEQSKTEEGAVALLPQELQEGGEEADVPVTTAADPRDRWGPR